MSEELNQRVVDLEKRVRELEDARSVKIDTRLEFERMNDVIAKEIAKEIERMTKIRGLA